MSDNFKEINYDYKPTWHATGARLVFKLDRPKEVEVGKVKVNTQTGMTSGGLILTDPVKNMDEKIQLGVQIEATVVSIGGCCFCREGLTDMLPGEINEVKPGTRIVVDMYQGKPIPDENGHRTLYYYTDEAKVVGLVENKK